MYITKLSTPVRFGNRHYRVVTAAWPNVQLLVYFLSASALFDRAWITLIKRIDTFIAK